MTDDAMLTVPRSRIGHRRLRLILIGAWLVVVGSTVWLFVFHREAMQRELQGAMSVSLWVAALVYVVLGSLRGFSLLPVTALLVLGLPFFSPGLLLVLTLVGILISSATVYWFSGALHLEEVFRRKHAGAMDRLEALLRRRELPIIVGWSFFPIVPTDLIVYVCGALRIDLGKCLMGVLIGEGAICAVYIFFGDWLLRTFGLKL